GGAGEQHLAAGFAPHRLVEHALKQHSARVVPNLLRFVEKEQIRGERRIKLLQQVETLLREDEYLVSALADLAVPRDHVDPYVGAEVAAQVAAHLVDQGARR